MPTPIHTGQKALGKAAGCGRIAGMEIAAMNPAALQHQRLPSGGEKPTVGSGSASLRSGAGWGRFRIDTSLRESQREPNNFSPRPGWPFGLFFPRLISAIRISTVPRVRRFAVSVAAGLVLFAMNVESAIGAAMIKSATILPGQEYIDFGLGFLDHVVAIRRVSATGAISYATGIKLSPRHILTAAHVVDSRSGFRPPERLKILIGSNFFSPDQIVDVSSYIIHPTYPQGFDLATGAQLGNQLDLAILVMNQQIDGGFVQLDTSSATNGTKLIYFGYGMPGLSVEEATSHDGHLRGGWVESDDAHWQFDDFFYSGTYASRSSAFPLPVVPTQGSSGSPLCRLSGDTKLIVGMVVASTGVLTMATYIDLTTPVVRAWIQANTQIPEDPGLPPNTDTNGNGFTELQEYHLDNLPKKFRAGDAVSLDLGAILLPLPTGQSLSMTGLPKGLRFDPVTGLLSGTITGLLGEAPVKILIKQGSRVIGSVLFDLKVEPYAFLGGYEVLIEEAGGLPVGKARLTVTGPGLFSATLELLGQAKRSAKGSFTHAPVADVQTLAVSFPAGRGGVPAATTLSFTVSSVSDLVGGTQEDRTLRGFRLVKPGTLPRQSVTMILDAAVAGDRINTPAGTGYARGTVATSGSLTLSGLLGDGRAFTTAPAMSRTNQAVFWCQPYKDKTGSYVGGIVTVGDLGLPGREAGAESTAAGLKWRKVAGAADQSYPLGIGLSSPLALNARFSRWTPRTTAESLAISLGLESRQLFPGYSSPTALVVPTVFSLTNGFNLLTLAPVVPAPFTGKLTGSNGALSGTLNKNATVSGVLLQDTAFGDRVGAGLIKFPTVRTPAVKGSFETGGFFLENAVPE